MSPSEDMSVFGSCLSVLGEVSRAHPLLTQLFFSLNLQTLDKGRDSIQGTRG